MKTDKFYLENGKEVHFGDVIKGHFDREDANYIVHLPLNKVTLPLLLNSGIITSKPVSLSTDAPFTITDIIARIANRLNWNPKKVENYLNGVYEIMPMAAFNIIAREIAVLLDEKYSDHINDSDKIYCVSSLDGRIHELPKSHIKNYRNFAAFRTVGDAKIACHILKDLLKEMFSGK